MSAPTAADAAAATAASASAADSGPGPSGSGEQLVDVKALEADSDVDLTDPKLTPGSADDEPVTIDEGGAFSRRTEKILTGVLAFLSVAALAVGLGVGLGLGMKTTPGDVSAVGSYTSVDLGSSVTGRTYFIAAEPILWDYAPSGRNLCYDNETAMGLLAAGNTRVGGTFAKAQYVEYTDSSFKFRKPRDPEWEHLGNVGPVIRGAVDDVIRVVFRNKLDFEANVVPAGGLVAYDGGGYYSARMQPIPPGVTGTFLWQIPAEAGPVANATVSSRMWLYGSTVDPTAHDNAGLVGPIIVTAAGANVTADGQPADVDREIVTIFQVFKEKLSAMLEANNDPALTEGVSFTKMAINGYTWCNMPPSAIALKVGQRVRWHLASVGDGESLHNYHWHGHGVELNGHHVDQFTAIPGAAYSVNMDLDEPGRWMFHCHVNLHMDGGMIDLYTVEGPPAPYDATGTERVFYVAAEEVEWSYTGANNTEACSPEPIPYTAEITDESPEGNQFVNGPSTDPVRLGHVYTKTLFREYTDATFTKLKERPEQDSYLGLVGPIFRATVGDTIKVVLLNRASFDVSMHPHGVRYSKANEGTLYEDGTTEADKGDDVVRPGASYTYKWLVPNRTGPGPRDPSSMLWMYHGHLDETAETYAGLAGGIIITTPEKLDPTSKEPRPVDVDHEIVIFFTVVDEIKSANFMYNLQTKLGDGGAKAAELAANETALGELVDDPDFAEHMLKHGINGFMYCHMPRLNFMQGDKVRLHVMVLGTLEDMHTPNMGGPRFDYLGQHTDSIQISPGGMVSADVLMTSPGDFELHCRVADHVASGMRAKYSVAPNPAAEATPLSGVNKTYYIQADPVDWNYAPKGYQSCTDSWLKWEASKYISKSAFTIGPKYRKAVYREYIDASFTTLKPTPAYYGTMGPTITVEVGDVLVVHLRNNITDLEEPFPVNLQSGGGLVAVGAEGENCAEVAPGETCVYRWVVPDSAGPAPGGFNTAVYGYTSAVDVVTAPNLGLAGALMVAARGELQPGSDLPKGVGMVVPLYWQVVNEEVSPYFVRNAEAAKINLTEIDDPDSFGATNFHEGNLKHSINGYLYCNLPDLEMKAGTNVRWLLVAYGTEGDMHAPVFSGQSVVVDRTGYSTLASLMPSIARVADMKAADPGSWLLACGVQDHYTSGMLAQFTVL